MSKASVEEKLNLINSRTHLGVSQIMKILNISHEKARGVIQDCNVEINRLGFKNYHDLKVPTDIFIKVSGLNLSFMQEQIKKAIRQDGPISKKPTKL